jgi:iron complex transport system permease protein
MLSLSGCLMQVLLRNPLADPYILGVSGGAAFFVLLGMTLGLATGFLPALAMTGALFSIVFSAWREAAGPGAAPDCC